jgi:hypothetical protein
MKTKTLAIVLARVLAGDCFVIGDFLSSGAWKKSISARDMTGITVLRKNKQKPPTIKDFCVGILILICS